MAYKWGWSDHHFQFISMSSFKVSAALRMARKTWQSLRKRRCKDKKLEQTCIPFIPPMVLWCTYHTSVMYMYVINIYIYIQIHISSWVITQVPSPQSLQSLKKFADFGSRHHLLLRFHIGAKGDVNLGAQSFFATKQWAFCFWIFGPICQGDSWTVVCPLRTCTLLRETNDLINKPLIRYLGGVQKSTGWAPLTVLLFCSQSSTYLRDCCGRFFHAKSCKIGCL